MNIAYVTSYDATDITSWSGTGYYIPKKLREEGEEIYYIGGLKNKPYLSEKLKEKYFEKVKGERYYTERNPKILHNWAKQILPRIKKGTELLLSPSSQPFSQVDTNVPMAFWTDANFADMIDFYPAYSNLSKSTIEDGMKMEKEALERVTLAVYSSEWAAQGAINHYGISPDKVKVVNYGANIDVQHTPESIKELASKKDTTQCNLLFLGVHWYRKGGDIALDVVKKLNASGIKARLSVVGCEPDNKENLPDFVDVYGFISKKDKEGKDLLNKLISESHFLILPTRADCTPIVYAEFNAHGIPVLTTNVGGIESVVSDSINGKTFSLESSAADYVKFIESMFSNFNDYKNLSSSAFNEFKTRLNWEVNIAKFRNMIHELK
jgi:glycosyltransferase involved in cell wall biosynthesis